MLVTFIRGVSKEVYSTYVYVPEGEELDFVVEGYRRAGLPGCVGSMDCTHVLWDKAAKKVANQCKKSRCAKTWSFEVVVDHNRRIHQSHSMEQLMSSVSCRMIIRILST